MSTNEYSTLIDILEEPVLILNLEGNIVSFNNAAIKYFLLRDKSSCVNLNDLVLEKANVLTQNLTMWSRSKSALPAGLTFKLKRDEIRKFVCKGQLIRPSTPSLEALIMVRCITKRESHKTFISLNKKIEHLAKEVKERQRNEKYIGQLNFELEIKVNERTKELSTTNDSLNLSLEKLKNTQNHLIRSERLAALGSMVAGIAHEINNPVGVCVTAASYQQDQVNHYRQLYDGDKLTRDDFESFLDLTQQSSKIVSSNLERAADLIRNFKLLAVDQTEDISREIKVKSYIEEVLLSLQPYFTKTQHSYEFNCSAEVHLYSYPGAITQILNNLIENSILHGFAGKKRGVITMDVDSDDSDLILDYSDNGNGISDENSKRIFDPFFTTRRNQGGSGLGMSIVYNLVKDKLFGEIKLLERKRQGISFRITLPLSIKNYLEDGSHSDSN